MALEFYTIVNPLSIDNLMIQATLTKSEWDSLTTLTCKAGSKILVKDFGGAGVHQEFIKKDNSDHSTTTGYTMSSNKIKSVSYPTTGSVVIDLTQDSEGLISQTGNITLSSINPNSVPFSNHTIIIEGNSANTLVIDPNWISTNGQTFDNTKVNRIDVSFSHARFYYSIIKSNQNDITAPTLTSAYVSANLMSEIVLQYSETLAANVIATSVFAVLGKTFSYVNVAGSTVRIGVTAPFDFGDTGKAIDYTAPLGDGNGIEDLALNNAASFAGVAINIPSYLLRDTYKRGNNTLTLGSAEIGGVYTPSGSAVFGIDTNRGYVVSALSSGSSVANVVTIDAGQANVNHSIDYVWGAIASGTSNVGLIIRYTDDNNYMLLTFSRTQSNNQVVPQIYKNVGGVFTLLITGTTVGSVTAGSTSNLKFVVNGNNYTGYVNNSPIISLSDGSIPSGNKVGIRIISGNTFGGHLDRFDELKVTPS